MPHMLTIAESQKPVRKTRASTKPAARKSKAGLAVVETQPAHREAVVIAEPVSVAYRSRMLRSSYRSGGFGDPL